MIKSKLMSYPLLFISSLLAPPPLLAVAGSCGSDFSAALNYYGGYYNASYTPNINALVGLKTDASISVWGDSIDGGSGAPTGAGYVTITSTGYAFTALKANGSLSPWGSSDVMGSSNWSENSAPTDVGYVSIASNELAFVALKIDGDLSAWGKVIGVGVESLPTRAMSPLLPLGLRLQL